MTDRQLDTRYVDAQFTAINDTLEKMYTRLEQVASMATQVALVGERQSQFTTSQDKTSGELHDLAEKLVQVEAESAEDNHQTRKELDKWINRGTGAWAVGILLVTCIQWIVMTQISSYNTHREKVDQSITAIDRRLTKIEDGQKPIAVKTEPK